MTDRPIIFSGPMIRALLDGSKTQTRRIIKPTPDYGGGGNPREPQNWKDLEAWGWEDSEAGCWRVLADGYTGHLNYSRGQRLWVRETFSGLHRLESYPPSQWLAAQIDTYEGLEIEEAAPIWYWADRSPDYGDWTRPRPSIHMPRWASRLTLTVTDVRVRRLQEISEADARAEGACDPEWLTAGNDLHRARRSFECIWNSIHGPDAWAANPWVVALTFDVHRCNIDQMGEGE